MIRKNNRTQGREFSRKEVETVFNRYPGNIRKKLLEMRELIFKTAAETSGVGEIEETLKWGQPSYLTAKSKSGTTIRIDQVASESGAYGIFVHCQTPLIGRFRSMYPMEFTYEKNRGIHFHTYEHVSVKKIRQFIAMALTYHLKKK